LLWGDAFNLLRGLRDLDLELATGNMEQHEALLEEWRAEHDALLVDTGKQDGQQREE
jgi:hypothetical protein